MDLNTSIAFLKNRVDQTLSVQREIAATWTWPLRTIAEWEADAEALDVTVENSPAQVAVEAHTFAEAARGALDARLKAIHTQTVAAVGIMRVRADRNRELVHVVNELSARADSRDSIEREGMAMLSAWKLEFGGTAFTPVPGVTYEGFRTLYYGKPEDTTVTPHVAAIPSLRELKEEYSDKATTDRKTLGRVNAILQRVEKDVQDWYAEATKAFVAGTEIGDLLRARVPTTTDYNAPTPAPQPTTGGTHPPVGGTTPPSGGTPTPTP